MYSISVQRFNNVFLATIVAASIIAVIVAHQALSSIVAIKSTYAIVGILVAVVIYYSSTRENKYPFTADSAHLGKLTAILIILIVPLSLITGSRLVSILIIPVAYVLLWMQIGSASPNSILTQLTGLYLSTPITKIVLSGLYFTNGDIFEHIRYTNILLETGGIARIPRYDSYPIYHILNGTMSHIANISTYTAMVLEHFVIFSILIPVVYLISCNIYDSTQTALFTSFAVTLVYTVIRYVTVYFPQSVATVLMMFLFYLSFKSVYKTGEDRYSLISVAFIIGITIILTHHLTVLLFIPIIAGLLVSKYVLARYYRTGRIGPDPIPVVVVMIGAFLYWVYEQQFLGELIYYISEVLAQKTVSEGKGWRTIVSLSRPLPELTTDVAIRSLGSAEAVYFILLIGILVLGVTEVGGQMKKNPRPLHVIFIGLLSTFVVLRTPFLPDISRIRFPLGILFAFPVGLGIERLSKASFNSQYLQRIPVTIIFLLAITAPITASQDLYSVHSGPDLYELRPLPEPEVEYSQTELRELEATADFVSNHNGHSKVGSFSMAQSFLKMNGIDSYEPAVSENGFQASEGLFVYRQSWVNHRNGFFKKKVVITLVLSKEWINKTAETENKVYTAGETGVLWQTNDGNLNPR